MHFSKVLTSSSQMKNSDFKILCLQHKSTAIKNKQQTGLTVGRQRNGDVKMEFASGKDQMMERSDFHHSPFVGRHSLFPGSAVHCFKIEALHVV